MQIDNTQVTHSHWPFRPAIKPDESFSSWFSRLALANGLRPHDLYPLALPGGRLHRLDLDRFGSKAMFENLARHTGVSIADMRAGTHKVFSGRLFDLDDSTNKLCWLPTAGTVRSQRSFGHQACPECLKKDEHPYLRKVWRLSFITVCIRHGCYLVDRCPCCGEPIQPLYAPAGQDDIVTCWHCGFNLRNAEPDYSIHHRQIDIQKDLLETVEEGWNKMGEYGPVYSIAYFQILWIIHRLLATGEFAQPLREWLHKNEQIAAIDIPRIKEVELLNPRGRAVLIQGAYSLMQNWPHRFIGACQHVGITSGNIIKDPNKTPFAIWDPVKWSLMTQGRAVGEAELCAAMAYYQRKGVVPTYRALCDLFGAKIEAHKHMAVSGGNQVPHGTHRYWKLDGVTPEVRSAARTIARREGENLGPWVNQVLKKALEQRGAL